MKNFRESVAMLATLLLVNPTAGFASSHREAPITALDRAADITDVYAFRSPDNPGSVTIIMNVDPLLEPGNGPTYFPFDPNIVYSINVDNDYDAVADLTFQFRFTSEIRAPGVFTTLVGAGTGIGSLVPPAITALDGTGSAGLNLRQSYTVNMLSVTGGSTAAQIDTLGNANGTGTGTGTGASAIVSRSLTSTAGTTARLFAVPTNVGPRTMPSYNALASQGIYSLNMGPTSAVNGPTFRVFAGTIDDPFFIDLGGVFDSLNLRANGAGGSPAVLTAQQDTINPGRTPAGAPYSAQNTTLDTVAGYNVNTIAFEVPIGMLTGGRGPTVGIWATTSRARTQVRVNPGETAPTPDTQFTQIQRMGNPLINEVIIGVGSKDLWSQSQPKNDSQFAAFALNPLLAQLLNAIYGVTVPSPPRADLLPLVSYVGPFATAGRGAGPVADLLRLNVAASPTPLASQSRLGLLGGDADGYPNGRRLGDDVVDISLRVVAGVLAPAGPGGVTFNGFPNNALGDGVFGNDRPFQATFPFVAFANNGRDRSRTGPLNTGSIDCVNNPLQPGCLGQ